MTTLKATVIISTYNQPIWLEKVLWGYEVQTIKNFEVIIADDGSTTETKNIIDIFKTKSSLSITHIWQEDDGFQKTKIFNRAVAMVSTPYIIFTDGDCIPRKDFVETHLNLSKSGFFLSGGYYKLPQTISTQISQQDIIEQNCFDLKWLIEKGLTKDFKSSKLTVKGLNAKLMNTFTTTKATFDGMNVSGWTKDVLEVNGFDERMQYGGEDREIGERLMNNGIRFKQIRYSAICVHLFHERSYVTSEMIENNKRLRTLTKARKLVWTDFGIRKNN